METNNENITVTKFRQDSSAAGLVTQVKVVKLPNKMFYITVTEGPTHNCQLSIIGAFCNLMSFTPEEIKTVLNKTYKEIHKFRKIILIDIQNAYVTNIENMFLGAVMAKTVYTSTNGSAMCIMLLRTSSIIPS